MPVLLLVHWYTQHPNKPHPQPPLNKVTHVLIGNGNISLDVICMLLTNVGVLSKYNVPHNILNVLATSVVKHISIIRQWPIGSCLQDEGAPQDDKPSMFPLPCSLITSPPSYKLTCQQTCILQLLQKGSKRKHC